MAQVDVAGERVDFLAVDEDLHALDRRQVDRDRVDDGVDGEQFVEAAAAVVGHGFLRQVDEGRAVLGDEDLPHLRAFGDRLRERRRRGLQLRLDQGAGLLGGEAPNGTSASTAVRCRPSSAT